MACWICSLSTCARTCQQPPCTSCQHCCTHPNTPTPPRPPPPIRYHDLAKAKLANLPASHANETVVSDGMPHLVQIQTRMAFLAFLVRRSPLTYGSVHPSPPVLHHCPHLAITCASPQQRFEGASVCGVGHAGCGLHYE